MIVAHSSEIEIKKSLILREKRLDLLGSENKMLYVVSLYKDPTGGPETLHQFARQIKNHGGEVAMVYFVSIQKYSKMHMVAF